VGRTGTLQARRRGRRRSTRCLVLLSAGSLAASLLALLLGPVAFWPLFLLPLMGAAVLLFEAGVVAVTLWAGVTLLVMPVAGPAMDLRDAVLGIALYLLAGLLLGRRQRHHKRLQTALATSSLTDRLTGVYNYGTFVDHLRSEVRTAERYGGELTLVMLDLDHFKRFNDAYGHQAGNALLRGLGATLRSLLRGADIVARYGGEEFAVLIRGNELDGLRLAERIRRAVLLIRVPVTDGEAYVTVSCGVACYPGDARDEASLIEYADAALYTSKQGGRNCVCGHTLGKVQSRAARKGALRAVGS
jgi:diguanylate cyclase (GGDEF)-like protein